MSFEGQNLNPKVFEAIVSEEFERLRLAQELNLETEDELDAYEVFDCIRHINDPEHPLTLEQLKVVTPDLIEIKDKQVKVKFTPTIPNCSAATLIGLMIKVKLERSLPSEYKYDVFITEGMHDQELAVNRQLNDKERVFAALENGNLLSMVNKGLYKAEKGQEEYLRQLGIKFDQ